MAQGNIEDLATIEMALVGYQIEKEKIEGKVREIQSLLKGKPAVAAAKKVPVVKRALSARFTPGAFFEGAAAGFPVSCD